MPQETNISQYQDHFRVYPDVPPSELEDFEARRVMGYTTEHAIGARAIHLVEQEDILQEEAFQITNHKDKAIEYVDGVPRSDTFRYFAKYKEKPLPGLRKLISRLEKQEDRKSAEIEQNKRKLQQELDKVRENISNAPPYILKGIEKWIRNGKSAPYLTALYERSCDLAIEAGEEEPDPVSWLLDDGEEGNSRLINFLKISVHGYEGLQDDEKINNLLEEEKTDWTSGVKEGVSKGWLHPDAVSVKDRLSDVTIRFADYFDLEAKHRGGYAYKDEKYIVLGRKEVDIKHAAKHELNHALLGSFGQSWLDEATTEHIAQVFNGIREVEDVGTDKYSQEDKFYDDSYRDERDLLSALLHMTDGQVKMSDVTRAYSEAYTESESAEDSAFTKLEAKIDTHLGVNFSLTLLGIHIRTIQEELMDTKGYHRMRALHEACRIARSDLLQQPDVIFNNPHELAA